jgi:hypothetical protein
MRQHEIERPYHVRRDPQQHFAFGEGLGDEAKLVVLQVPQAAVNQLAARRRRGGAEIALLHQKRPQAPASGVARDADAVDAAADDDEIERVRPGTHASAVRNRARSRATNAAS